MNWKYIALFWKLEIPFVFELGLRVENMIVLLWIGIS
jgi:hypothetical protein